MAAASRLQGRERPRAKSQSAARRIAPDRGRKGSAKSYDKPLDRQADCDCSLAFQSERRFEADVRSNPIRTFARVAVDTLTDSMANILLLDESDVAGRAMQGILARGNHGCFVATEPEQAWKMLREGVVFDLLFVELKLADSSGRRILAADAQ